MSSIQASHGVAGIDYDALPYRTGYEEVIATRVNDYYSIMAEDEGEITYVKPDILIVHYKTLGKKSYKIGIKHGVVSGTTIPHEIICDLSVGFKFKKGHILAYNKGFFKRSELHDSNVVYKAGVIGRVAFLEVSDTIEDSCSLSQSLCDKLATPYSTLHNVIIDFNTVIHNLVEIGDTVEPNSILCTMEAAIADEVSSQDKEAVKALSVLASNNPKAKAYGKISNIEIIYFGNIEDMHFSLQKLVTDYDKKRSSNVKRYGTNDAKTGQVNETFRIGHQKLVHNQLVIRIYIDGKLAMNAGSKVVFGSALKSVCSRVTTDKITTKDGVEVDAVFSYHSIINRIVKSPEISGIMNSVLKELSKQMGTLYVAK